jgi:hypothetical protein
VLWAQVIGCILRQLSHAALEALVRSPARRALAVRRGFSDDTLSYLNERLDPETLREAITGMLRRAKRNKAFDGSHLIGFAIDGTGTARCSKRRCPLCHPIYDADHNVSSHLHHFSMILVAGVGLSLPFDVEPWGPGDSEYAASQRLLLRAVQHLGRRFADYVVADGEYATAPFLHAVGDLGLQMIARLKSNLPELLAAAEKRFQQVPPSCHFYAGQDRIEMWDADDFDPWVALRWTTVRVIRYRQHKPNGEVVEAYWLTDFPTNKVSTQTIYYLAKSRWEIENQGFNDAKNRYGMEHIAHHEENSLLIRWLLILLSIVIERLYRERHLKRGNHRAMSPIQFLRLLQLSLALRTLNTS